MAWEKGQSGNPGGRGAPKPWKEALNRALARRAEGKGAPQALELVAEACVAAAIGGDITAIKEIGDRLDGKAKQEMDVTMRNMAEDFVAMRERLRNEAS